MRAFLCPRMRGVVPAATTFDNHEEMVEHAGARSTFWGPVGTKSGGRKTLVDLRESSTSTATCSTGATCSLSWISESTTCRELDGALLSFVHNTVRQEVLDTSIDVTQNDDVPFEGPKPSILKGFLFKKGHRRKNWRRRLIVLSSAGELAWYCNSGTKRGAVCLVDQHVTIRAGTTFRTCISRKTGKSPSTNWRFEVLTGLGESLMLSCINKEEMQKWISHIYAVCRVRSTFVNLAILIEAKVQLVAKTDYIASRRIGRHGSSLRRATRKGLHGRGQRKPVPYREEEGEFLIADKSWFKQRPSQDGILRIIRLHEIGAAGSQLNRRGIAAKIQVNL